jgi:Fe-S-cluster containining protein
MRDVAVYGGCAACEGRCCRDYVVLLSGYDVARLAEATGLLPVEFVALRRIDAISKTALPSGHGARLEAGGHAFSTVLDKRPGPGSECVFLMNIRTGRSRCGVYSHRPSACAAFPFTLRHGTVAPRAEACCGRDAWNIATVDLVARKQSVLRVDLEWAVHELVLQCWNDRVDQNSTRRYRPRDLFEHILRSYARMDDVRAAYRDGFDQVVLSWGRSPIAGDEPAWTGFLDEVRDALREPSG